MSAIKIKIEQMYKNNQISNFKDNVINMIKGFLKIFFSIIFNIDISLNILNWQLFLLIHMK